MHGWTHRDSLELYNVEAWGAGFFTVNDRGHVEVRPHGPDGGRGIDLLELVRDLEQRGLRAAAPDPLLRHPRRRVRGICATLRQRDPRVRLPAARYRGVYPIKVNQQRHVVEEIVEFGAPVRASASRPAASPSCWSRSRCSTRPAR